jgi:ArsR family transcriptional regulator
MKGNFKIASLRGAAAEATRLLKVLGNSERLLLLCELASGERCVSELEALLDIHQPTLSQQLGVLREEKLVETRREGKNVHYRIASPQALAVMNTLYEQYCKRSAA